MVRSLGLWTNNKHTASIVVTEISPTLTYVVAVRTSLFSKQLANEVLLANQILFYCLEMTDILQ